MIKPVDQPSSALDAVNAVATGTRLGNLPGEAGRARVAVDPPRVGDVSASGAVTVELSEAALYVVQLLQAVAPQGSSATALTLAAPAVLLGDPPPNAVQRAESVAQAIAQSGLFYESHVRAWAEGRWPLDRLMGEPQARAAESLKDASHAERDAANAELGGLLQRQLDALDGKPLAFAGTAWPGQRMEWRIQREVDDMRDDSARHDNPNNDHNNDPHDSTERPPTWTTQLHLDLPLLGALGAQVRVVGSQVQLGVTLGSDASTALLNAHRGRLASALQAVGLTLAALRVASHERAGPPQA